MSEEVEEFRDSLLKVKGVTPQLAALFREAGYYTIESLAVEVPHILLERIGERVGFNLEKAREITKEARSHLKVKTMTVAELLEEEKKRKSISTGSKALDEILGGGIHTHELTEVVGPYASGKTELVYTTAVLATQELGPAWVLDTEATLSARRIWEIAAAMGLKAEEVIKQIRFDRVLNSSELVWTLENAHKIIKDYGIRFLAIDSFVSPFRRDYPGRELLTPRQQKLNYCIGLLLKFAWAYEMAVLVTNQVLATPVVQFTTRPELLNPPVGGHVMSHGVNNRIYVMPSPEPYKWVATLIDSSYLPRRQAAFKVTEKGIED